MEVQFRNDREETLKVPTSLPTGKSKKLEPHSIGVLLTHRILSLRDGLKLELSDVRKQLRVEYMHYMSKTGKTYSRPKDFDKCTLQEFRKYQTCVQDIKANEEKSTNAMPYLATFVLAIMEATAANVAVERSFKCQKFVWTAERNRLSEYKTNQEMMIRFNHFSDSREEKSRERFGNVLKKGFKSKYSEQEIQAIDGKIDEKEEKTVEEKNKKKTYPKKSQPRPLKKHRKQKRRVRSTRTLIASEKDNQPSIWYQDQRSKMMMRLMTTIMKFQTNPQRKRRKRTKLLSKSPLLRKRRNEPN